MEEAASSGMGSSERIVIVQCIDTHWTKASRGAPGASKRNASPHALRLPFDTWPPGEYSLIEHRTGFYESLGFEPKVSVELESLSLGRTLRFGAVLIQREADRLTISWDNSSQDAGMPLRPSKKKDVFELAASQWGRVVHNGRFNGMEGSFWSYRHKVLNIGVFEAVNPFVFVATEPHVVMDKTAALY